MDTTLFGRRTVKTIHSDMIAYIVGTRALGCGDFKKKSQIIVGIREPASLPDRSVAVYFVL